MKFKFSLDPLMKYRKRLEQEAFRNYIEARNQLDEALTVLEALYDSVDNSVKSVEKVSLEGGKASHQYSMLNSFMDGQKIKIERQKVEIRMLKINVEEKQALHLEAAKEFKVIEKLKEKRFEQHKEVLKRKELKVVDDLVVMSQKRRTA